MAINLQVLKTELETDPNGYGYAALITASDWIGLAAALNQHRASISIARPDVTPLEILEAINVSDFLSNTNTYWSSWFESLTQFQSLRILKADGSDTRVMNNILKMLTNGSQSESRVRALASRIGSRIEQLFGPGESVTWELVLAAYRS